MAAVSNYPRLPRPGTGRRRVHLAEDVLPLSSRRVDRKAGVIRGVKVLGRFSDNNREYTPEAMRRAIPLYEGASVRTDHPAKPTEERKAREVFGWLRNVRVEDGSLWADLHYLKSHPMAESICETAERNPELMGLSHNADGRGEDVGGRFVVSEIVQVRSVDLVTDPATVNGLFESQRRRSMYGRLRLQRRRVREGKVHPGIVEACMDIIGQDDLGADEKVERISRLLSAHEGDDDAPGSTDDDQGDTDYDDPAQTAESRRRRSRSGRDLLENSRPVPRGASAVISFLRGAW